MGKNRKEKTVQLANEIVNGEEGATPAVAKARGPYKPRPPKMSPMDILKAAKKAEEDLNNEREQLYARIIEIDEMIGFDRKPRTDLVPDDPHANDASMFPDAAVASDDSAVAAHH